MLWARASFIAYSAWPVFARCTISSRIRRLSQQYRNRALLQAFCLSSALDSPLFTLNMISRLLRLKVVRSAQTVASHGKHFKPKVQEYNCKLLRALEAFQGHKQLAQSETPWLAVRT